MRYRAGFHNVAICQRYKHDLWLKKNVQRKPLAITNRQSRDSAIITMMVQLSVF